MNRCIHIILLGMLLLVSCHKKPAPPQIVIGLEYEDPYDYSGVQEDAPHVENSPKQETTDSTTQNIPQRVYDIWSYTPQRISVPSYTTFERAVYSTYPNMRLCYNYDNVGGIKLIGEMSADKFGYNNSFYSDPITLNVLSLSQLSLGFISSSNNILCQVLNRNVKIDLVRIWSGFKVELVIKNQTHVAQTIEIERGQMIEVNENHVQNIVVNSRAEFIITPDESRRISVPAYCASHHRGNPSGYTARITPYVLNAPASTFCSQQQVWKLLEEGDDPNSYITFYVWGKGTITSSGKPSPTGHAFVRIPQVGIIGFGSLHGGLLDDEGNIFDHTSKVRFVTDSCRIKVSEEAQKAMIKKLRQLQSDVPKYRVGRYDCTSFVMDIADAGGVHYGSRITIQTPVGFMQELKKHNYFY